MTSLRPVLQASLLEAVLVVWGVGPGMRYPTRGSVKMYLGLLSSSPSLRRSLLTMLCTVPELPRGFEKPLLVVFLLQSSFLLEIESDLLEKSLHPIDV